VSAPPAAAGRAGSSLTGRVLLVLALAVATPTIIVGTLAINRARASLEEEVVRGNLALIRALGASLDRTLQNARRELGSSAAAWADQRSGAPADAARERADAAATERLLRRLRREIPLFAALSIIDVEGERVAGDAIAIPAGAGAGTFGGYIGDITFEEGVPRILVVTQARSRTGELVGVFVAKLDLGFVADTLAEARLGKGARLLVVDGQGVPVARSDGEPVAGATSLRAGNPAVNRALGSAEEGSVEAGGTVAVYRNLSSFQSLRGVRWAIILEQPERDAYALAYSVTQDTVTALILSLLAALVVGSALATRLTRPLHALAERADAIAVGGSQLAATEPVQGPGEIGWLSQRLEDMARRLGEREQLKEALARGDRLATVGTMSASVAHEINNPLTTVLGYAKLLLEDKPDEHADRFGLELIADEAARMQDIVRNLLDYSRSSDGTSGASDVNQLVERTTALLEPQVKKSHVEFDLDLAPALPRARADAHGLQQVFVNLAQNAADAMPDGGTVRVQTSLGPGATHVVVGFTDEGPGIDEADHSRVFDPFYTTKGEGKGTGLGLAVVKHLVGQAGGTITLEDGDDGVGACFKVMIPIIE